MATFALTHGGGGSAWDWHRVVPVLRAHGHEAVAVDLPLEADAGWWDGADAVAGAVAGHDGRLVVVAHSYGGFTAPLVCERADVDLLVLVSAMIPAPGEDAGTWWQGSGWSDQVNADFGDPDHLFYHDVSPALAAEAQEHEREPLGPPEDERYPLTAWPDVPTRVLAFEHDRLFPVGFQRRLALDRLGLDEIDTVPGGHYGAISRPQELADRLHRYAA